MRILFVGESWFGSCARSLREALTRRPELLLDDLAEDCYLPRYRGLWPRLGARLLRPAGRRDLHRALLERVRGFAPDLLLTYKGTGLDARLLARVRALGCPTVNVYPDCSPHAHGRRHRAAVGCYDLVVSTKPFHVDRWKSFYGYSNPCVFVPQGYDPTLHLVPTPPPAPDLDLILAAYWRPEYGRLMREVAARLDGSGVTVGIGGYGWERERSALPADWLLAGPLHGRRYVDWLRRGRICLAPVTREPVVDGVPQPGDEDSTRTYELAAAHCCFIHRRTPYLATVYDEATEVPMFDTPADLVALVRWLLPRELERHRLAAAAHRRAVPSYSLDARAADLTMVLQRFLDRRRGAGPGIAPVGQAPRRETAPSPRCPGGAG